jgi:RNA polymerase sigma-70 factor (ECF subfamily)
LTQAQKAPLHAGSEAIALTFEAVYAEHAPFVWRTLRRLGVREGDVADACQEVFVVVHRGLPTFDGTAHVRGWLFGIARRAASDYRRRAHIRHEIVGDEIPDAGVEPGQHAALEQTRARALLDGALQTLDDDKRAVFVLYELEQLTLREVATMVNCPLPTAYSRLTAARSQVEATIRRACARRGP